MRGGGSRLCKAHAPLAGQLSSGTWRAALVRFTQIHGFAPDRIVPLRCPRLLPPVLVQVGELRGLIYASDRFSPGQKRTYIHFVQRPTVLACNPQGDQLYVLGGRYRVTRRGIEG